MNYKLFLAGLVDELEKAAKEDGSEPWHPTPEDKKKDVKKEDVKKEEPEAPPAPVAPEGEDAKEASLESAFMFGFFGKLAAEDEDEDDDKGNEKGNEDDDKDEKSPMARLKEKLKEKKEKKEKKGGDEEDKGEEKKEASEMSELEQAFFTGLLDELEKSAGWRGLGAGRIAKMKARMGAGLKSVRGKALTSLKATGKTGTPLYSAGERRKAGGKFYEQYGGKGFKARQRDPSRRTGAKFQERVQAAIQSRKPGGPSAGERMKSWGAGIKQKVTGAARGAAQGAGRQLAGAKGAIAGAARGAAAGAAQGRAAAMTPSVKTTAAKIPARTRLEETQVPVAA